MSRQNRILALSQLLLRLGIVLALFVMLTLRHPGMTAVTETPAMTMHHTADAQGQMSQSGGVLDRMNGALCAMLCVGVDRADGPVHPVHPVWFVDFVLRAGRLMQFPFGHPSSRIRPGGPPIQLQTLERASQDLRGISFALASLKPDGA